MNGLKLGGLAALILALVGTGGTCALLGGCTSVTKAGSEIKRVHNPEGIEGRAWIESGIYWGDELPEVDLPGGAEN